MAEYTQELNALFDAPGDGSLPPDIVGELLSMMRLHSMPPQELFYKWESYSIKMGSDETKLDLATARAFKADIQETLERDSRGKAHLRSADKRGVHATPRMSVGNGDVFSMLDSIVPTPQTKVTTGATKRKSAFETPNAPKVSRSENLSSPSDGRVTSQSSETISKGLRNLAFGDRQNPGQVVETLNSHIDLCEPPIAPPPEARIKLKANTDLQKFYYKPMAMHLSEASEVLDDRIDEFMNLVQVHHGLEDIAFGSAASKSTGEVIAVGRIASDALEGKLNTASLVLEMSRRMGAGLRVPLRIDSVSSWELFPGQIVAVRGTNASGDYFSVNEVLGIPLLSHAASLPSTLDAVNERLGVVDDETNDSSTKALNVLVASGPYTADDNLAFEPLQELCDKASKSYADALVLIGPFLDIEHPLVASGDFELPDDPSIEPDRATLTDAFRLLIGVPLQRLARDVPSITIILVPSVRDAVSKHVSWPQEPFPKKGLGLPRQAKMVSNPVTISLNEIVVGISAQDVLYDLRREAVVVGEPQESNILARLPRHLIQQRHFYPIFPPTNRSSLPKPGIPDGIATGMPLDISYLKLGEWLNARPDMLITPSTLSPFAKVVETVLVVNPGPLSKRKGAGTYAQITIRPRNITRKERSEEQETGLMVDHRLFDRARVDVVRI